MYQKFDSLGKCESGCFLLVALNATSEELRILFLEAGDQFVVKKYTGKGGKYRLMAKKRNRYGSLRYVHQKTHEFQLTEGSIFQIKYAGRNLKRILGIGKYENSFDVKVINNYFSYKGRKILIHELRDSTIIAKMIVIESNNPPLKRKINSHLMVA